MCCRVVRLRSSAIMVADDNSAETTWTGLYCFRVPSINIVAAEYPPCFQSVHQRFHLPPLAEWLRIEMPDKSIIPCGEDVALTPLAVPELRFRLSAQRCHPPDPRLVPGLLLQSFSSSRDPRVVPKPPTPL